MSVTKDDLTKLHINLPDEILDFLINLTDKKIKNFCNIESIPEELKETQIQMCIDLYDLRYKSILKNNVADNTETNTEENNVKSIVRGDTKIEFNVDQVKQEKEAIQSLINSDSFIFNYENELYDFRKMRW